MGCLMHIPKKLKNSERYYYRLPDNYARGRIIGDYRRSGFVWHATIEAKNMITTILYSMTDESIRLRQEVAAQIKALED